MRTPEERAARVLQEWSRHPGQDITIEPLPFGSLNQQSIADIAAAIREAIEEEQEACAQLAELAPYDIECVYSDEATAKMIAAAIRKRGRHDHNSSRLPASDPG